MSENKDRVGRTTLESNNSLKTKNVSRKLSGIEESIPGSDAMADLTVQRLVKKSSLLLSDLDKLKDAVHYRGGSTGETPYFVSSTSIESIAFSLKYNEISLLRSVRPGDCTDLEKKFLYSPKLFSQQRGYKIGNPAFISKETLFYKLDSPSSISSIYFFIGYLEVLFDSYPDFADKPFYNDLLEAFVWLSSLSPVKFVKYAKYITAFPMAKYMHQEDLPPIPNEFPFERRFLFIGRLKKFIRNRVYSFNQKNTSFMLGLLQGVKRAAYKVPESFILDSLISHAEILSKESKYNQNKLDYDLSLEQEAQHLSTLNWGDAMEEEETFVSPFEKQRLEFQLFDVDFLRMVSSIARTFVISPDYIFSNKWVPSSSGAYDLKRSKGGQIGLIQREYVLHPLNLVEDYNSPFERNFYKNVHDHVEYDDSQQSIYRHMDHPPRINEDLLSIHENNGQLHTFRGLSLPPQSIIKQTIPKLLFKAKLGELPLDRVVALPEPLKVRTITVGSAELYFAAKPLQQALWGHIGRFSQFSLVKEPLAPYHLHELIRQEIVLMRKLKQNLLFTDFVSGDYKAATDGLDIHYSKEALKPFMDNAIKLFPELADYFKAVAPALAEHELRYEISNAEADRFIDQLESRNVKFTYSVDDDITIFCVEQRNGQLMGSPLSFPILCIVNLVSYWRSLEIYTTKRIKFQDLPVKVNGDDILFRSNPKHYAIWKEQIEFVSFTLSLGKNYIHKNLLTVNSVMYSFHLSSEEDYLFNIAISDTIIDTNFIGDWRFEEVSYMNPGLLTAQSKGTMRDKTRSLPLGDLYEIAVGYASDRYRAHQRFIHYNIENIKKMTSDGKFNLFIPIHLGGLGFKLFPEVEPFINFTVFQRRFASFLLFNIRIELKKGKYPQKYFSALVDDGTSSYLPFFEKFKGQKELYLESDIDELSTFEPFEGFERVSPPTLSQLIVVPDVILKYRLPSKSLMREFNRAVRNDTYLPHMAEMSEAEILSAPSKPSLFNRISKIPVSQEYFSEIEGIAPEYRKFPSLPVLTRQEGELSEHQLEILEFMYGILI